MSSVTLSDDVKIAASIGHICLQWARLEMALLGVIYALENCPAAKGEIIYGGLDMLPRCGMAINLARYHKAPVRLIRELEAIRKALQGGGLSDARNQAVHGVHRESEKPGHTNLTMVRWRGDKRAKDVSAIELHDVAVRLLELGDRTWAVFNGIGEWKFGDHRGEDVGDDLPVGNPVQTRRKLTQRAGASFKHLWRKLKS